VLGDVAKAWGEQTEQTGGISPLKVGI
jgi:hypothetical protein